MTTSSNDRYRRAERARRPRETNKYLEHLSAKHEAALNKYGSHLSLSERRPPRGDFLGSSVLYDDNEGLEEQDPEKRWQ
jgi:hypothetical protein